MTIKYTDNYGKKRTMEVPDETSERVLEFMKEEERTINREKAQAGYWLEQFDMTEEELYSRAMDKPIPLEEEYSETEFDNQLCKEAMEVLMKHCTPIQRGRFYLHILYGIPTETIAYWQSCSVQAVRRSIQLALDQLRQSTKK